MKPTQKEMDEFALDLVEFLGKHFTAYFDKTKVAGGNLGVSVSIRNLKAGSEVELSTEGGRVLLRIGPATHRFPPTLSREKLFSHVLSDLIAVFENRLVLVTGGMAPGGGEAPGALYLDMEETGAMDRFKTDHPGCVGVTLKKWTDEGRA